MKWNGKVTFTQGTVLLYTDALYSLMATHKTVQLCAYYAMITSITSGQYTILAFVYISGQVYPGLVCISISMY